MRAVCIDFETANSYKASICAVGIAIIEDCKIVDSAYWLVKPHVDHRYFDPFNIQIHGIGPNAVEDAQEFNVIFKKLKPLLRNAVLVAHNAEFDICALQQVLSLYKLEYPGNEYLCTYLIAKSVWEELPNHKLHTVCNFLGYSFEHHNAHADALACAQILLAAFLEKNVSTLKELAACTGLHFGRLYKDHRLPCKENIYD